MKKVKDDAYFINWIERINKRDLEMSNIISQVEIEVLKDQNREDENATYRGKGDSR